MEPRLVISLGGSILVRGEDDAEYLAGIAKTLIELSSRYRIIVVTGGGRTARDYIRLGRSVGADEATLDVIGIAATRLNAFLLLAALDRVACPKPFDTIDECLVLSGSFRIVVGGGTHPGHTTDAVSALIAERWGADLFMNLTSVPGAFTSDPAIDPRAKRIDSMTSKELLELVDGTVREAGAHSPMDPLASRIVHRAGLRTCILHGRDLVSIVDCAEGRMFNGTTIVPSGDV